MKQLEQITVHYKCNRHEILPRKKVKEIKEIKYFLSNYLPENNCSSNTYLLVSKYSFQEISTLLEVV